MSGGSDTNYTINRVDGTLIIADREVPGITWNEPAPISYGIALDGTQLNATTNVAGTFSYAPASGTPLDAGTYTLTTQFTPEDTARYAGTSKTVTLTVTPAPLTITADDKQRGAGLDNPPLTASYSGFVNGDIAISTPPALSTTANTSSAPGNYPITVTGGNDANYTISHVAGVLTVAEKEIPVIAWNDPAPVTFGSALDSPN